MLYYTTINGKRLLVWLIVFTLALPLFLGIFLLVIFIARGQQYFREQFMMEFPWIGFGIVCAVIGLIIAALAWWESSKNNKLWEGFFALPGLQVLKEAGFHLDRYGLHGTWKGMPVSIYYEKETLGDFAKITAYADVSNDVDELRALGEKMGEKWFFLFNEYERFIDPPFDHTEWDKELDLVADMGTAEKFSIAKQHPWRIANS